MKRLIILAALPLSVALGQARPISPYASVGTGVGTLGWDDDAVKTLAAGVTLWNRLGIGVEHMELSGDSEHGHWTVGTVQAHLRSTTRRFSPWLAGGIGSASAGMPDDEGTASNRTYFRFSGSALHSAVGFDLGLVPHLFVSPSLSVKKSIGDAEGQSCQTNFTTGQTSCGPWSAAQQSFQTFELRVALGTRY